MSQKSDDDDFEPLDPDELLEEIVRTLVRNPRAVHVTTVPRADCTELQVHTDADDRRFVIGRRGATVMALRTLFQLVGGRVGKNFTIEIVESDEERLAHRGPKPV